MWFELLAPRLRRRGIPHRLLIRLLQRADRGVGPPPLLLLLGLERLVIAPRLVDLLHLAPPALHEQVVRVVRLLELGLEGGALLPTHTAHARGSEGWPCALCAHRMRALRGRWARRARVRAVGGAHLAPRRVEGALARQVVLGRLLQVLDGELTCLALLAEAIEQARLHAADLRAGVERAVREDGTGGWARGERVCVRALLLLLRVERGG